MIAPQASFATFGDRHVQGIQNERAAHVIGHHPPEDLLGYSSLIAQRDISFLPQIR